MTSTANGTVPLDAGSDAPEVVLRAQGITKSYGAVAALSNGCIELRSGEIMGLVGDNGAGKTTLVKTISGSVERDGGELEVLGEPRRFKRPADALAAGIETVYQDLSLVDPVSALGNIFLGREVLRADPVGRALRLVDNRAMRQRAQEILDDLGARIPSIKAPVRDLSGGQRQSLAIARAVLFGHRIVILDEPTAALGVRETEHVLEIIQRLRRHGASVIVISHNIEQLMRFADRVTVLRLGRTVGVREIARTTPQDIVALITGATAPDAQPPTPGENP